MGARNRSGGMGGIAIGSLLLVGLVSALGAANAPEEEGSSSHRMRIASEKIPLYSLAKSEGVPRLGELYRGATVRILERRDGFSRVELVAWVQSADLTEVELGEPSGPDPSVPVTVEHPKAALPARHLPPVEGAQHTLSVRVQVRLERREDPPELAFRLHLGLEAEPGRPVRPTQDLPVLVSVFAERRLKNARAQGQLLARRNYILPRGQSLLRLPRAELAEAGSVPRGIFTVRVTLPGGRVVYGAAEGVELQEGALIEDGS